jgi:hypothetical protein
MAGVTSAAHPGVLWAQRARLAFVTVEVSDCENPEIKVKQHVITDSHPIAAHR